MEGDTDIALLHEIVERFQGRRVVEIAWPDSRLRVDDARETDVVGLAVANLVVGALRREDDSHMSAHERRHPRKLVIERFKSAPRRSVEVDLVEGLLDEVGETVRRRLGLAAEYPSDGFVGRWGREEEEDGWSVNQARRDD